MLLLTAALVLRLELTRYSLTGTHYRFRQFMDETPIAGAEVNLTVRPDGKSEEIRSLCVAPPPPASSRSRITAEGDRATPFIVNVHGVARYARRVVEDRVARYYDIETGELVREEPQYFGAKPARVFESNPVEKLNDPSLQDQNNSATAVPDAAYSEVSLDNLNESGPLGGRFVQIADLQAPSIAPVDVTQSLVFNRSQSGFEDVNAYFQIDRSQNYLHSLGYGGVRAIAPYPVPVDTHAANGDDNSFFIPATTRAGEGALFFGDGGTDDAEDANLVVHEYAHAIHEWIAPGTFLGSFSSEARAMSEGFADYWSFSSSYQQTTASGRDPFCFADWDARCWQDAASEHCGYAAGSNCLRRLDSTKTIVAFNSGGGAGSEYINGEIWSSALREIFVAMTQRQGVDAGKQLADKIVIESLFGAPPNPSFAGIARKMIAADHYLTAGANADLICAAMTARGILSDCVVLPRGELTFFQSSERGIAIPENDVNGVTLRTFVSDSRPIEHLFVNVNATHPNRGDLQIVLIAPDGTEVVLQNQSNDRTADIRATFGRDAVSAQPLDVFRGRSARGEWKLRISDVKPRDSGSIASWNLVLQFAGDTPAATRPEGEIRQFIPVVGRGPGANNTFFRTDVRLLNRTERDVTATLIFTPSGADGRTDFSAVQVKVAAGSVATLADIVGTTFTTSGLGSLEVDGDVAVVTRTYTRNADGGTLGEFIRPTPARKSAYLIRLYNNAQERTNIGFAETAGEGGRIRLSLIDIAKGMPASVTDYLIAPYGHIQIPALGAEAMIASFISTTDVVSYASVIDNNTGDATYLSPGSSTPRLGLAPAISRTGAFGTRWTTDVWFDVVIPSPTPASDPLIFIDSTTLHQTRAEIPWQRQAELRDVVATTFSAPDSTGVLATRLGETPVSKSVVIANGGYRQSVSFLTPIAGPQDLAYVEVSDAFRTNVGLMSDRSTTVRVTLFDAAGRQIDSTVHELLAYQLDQFAVPQRVVDGFIRVEAVGGVVCAYASVVDNITGDASFVPAQPAEASFIPGQ